MAEAQGIAGGRLAWPDVAKGIGIVLMYYGHVLACLPAGAAIGTPGPGLEEMRFIYAFHMPLFFLLAGVFFRPAADPAARRRELARRRLVPVAFFSLLLLPLWLASTLRHGTAGWTEFGPMLAAYLRGHPTLDWVTWFLVCLFVCECMALSVLPRLKSPLVQGLAGMSSIWAGVLACNHADTTAAVFGVEVQAWFIYEALVALGFYIIGHALAPALARLSVRKTAAVGTSVLGFGLALLSYRLNESIHQLPVMMAAGRHGDPLMFIIAALGGSAGVIGLAMACAPVRWLVRVGRHSLPLLGLSGFFFHFANPRLEVLWPSSGSAVPLTLHTLIVTAASLAVALPAAERLMSWVPQLLGGGERLPPTQDGLRSIAAE